MPTSKKKQQQQRDQDEEQSYGSIEDRVSEFVEMYPVFCTANIPSKVCIIIVR